jgi:hypothetical protein
MRRIGLAVVLAGSLVLAPDAAKPQPPPRIYGIGAILQGGPYYATIDGLRDGLRDLGLEEESSCRGSARVDAGAVREGQVAGDDRARRVSGRGRGGGFDIEKIASVFPAMRSKRSLCRRKGSG